MAAPRTPFNEAGDALDDLRRQTRASCNNSASADYIAESILMEALGALPDDHRARFIATLRDGAERYARTAERQRDEYRRAGENIRNLEATP